MSVIVLVHECLNDQSHECSCKKDGKCVLDSKWEILFVLISMLFFTNDMPENKLQNEFIEQNNSYQCDENN